MSTQMKASVLQNIKDARQTNGRFGSWQYQASATTVGAGARTTEAFKYEVSEYLSRAAGEGDVAGECVATYSLAARSVLADHPDAASLHLHQNTDGEYITADVRDNYGSALGSYNIGYGDPTGTEKLLERLLREEGTSEGDDFEETWAATRHEADREFRDTAERAWWPNAAGTRMDLAKAADWAPPQTELQKLDDYSRRLDVPLLDRTRAEYSAAARAVKADLPHAHSIVLGEYSGDMFDPFAGAKILDANGTTIASYDFMDDDDSSEASERIKSLVRVGDDGLDPLRVNAGDAVTEEFRDQDARPWHAEQPWRIDLTAAAAWTLPDETTRQIDAYRSRPDISPTEKARADLAGAARSVRADYPDAHTVSLITIGKDREAQKQAAWDRMQPRGSRASYPPVQMDYRTPDMVNADSRYLRADVLDDDGSTLGSYDLTGNSNDYSVAGRIRAMLPVILDPQAVPLDEAALEFEDQEHRPSWKQGLKGFDLRTAAAWTPPAMTEPAAGRPVTAAPAPLKAQAPARWWQRSKNRA